MAAADYNYGAPSSGPAAAGYQYNYDSQYNSPASQPYSSSYPQQPSSYGNYNYDQSYNQQPGPPPSYSQSSGYEQSQGYDQASYGNSAATSYPPQESSYSGYDQSGPQGYPSTYGQSDSYASQSEPIKIVSPGAQGNYGNGPSQSYNSSEQSSYSGGYGNNYDSSGQGPPSNYNPGASSYNQSGFGGSNFDPQNGFNQNSYGAPPDYNSSGGFGGPPNAFDGPPPNSFGGNQNGYRGRGGGGGFRGGDRGGGFMSSGRGRGGASNRDGGFGQMAGNGGSAPRYEIQEDTIFISNLPKDVTQDQLRENFASAGPLKIDVQTSNTKCWVYRDREKNEGKGEATVTYESSDIANSAVEMYNGQTILGVTVQVNISKKRLPDTPGVGSPMNKGGAGMMRGSRNGFSRGGNMGGGPNRPTQDDWICLANGCNNKNFAWRPTCNRCQAPRPEGLGGDTSPRGGRGGSGSRGGFRGGPPSRGGPTGMRGGGFSSRGGMVGNGGGFRGLNRGRGGDRGRGGGGGDRGRGGPDRRGGRPDRRDKPY